MPDRKSILLVDDDDLFRSALKRRLEESGFSVVDCEGGRKAAHLFQLESFDAVITDIRMPEGHGLELLHFVKRQRSVPVVLMTGFAELSETQEAHELGADAFFPKPFKPEDLVTALSACGLQSVSQKQGPTDEDFCKLGIDDFVTGKEIQFDIFIRLGADKFVKIAHQGEDIPVDRIKSYKAKGIRHLYMLKEHFRRYVGFNITVAQALNQSSTVDPVKKLNFAKHTGEVIMEHLHFNEIDEDTFESTRTVVENTVMMLSESQDTFDLLTILNSHSDALYAHSLGVSFYSTMLARALKWHSPITQFKIAVGGLLHDIGKKEIERAILDKPRRNLTAAEIKSLETHPTRGRDILAEVKSIPGDILQIVLEHHEDCLGQGYPRGIRHRHIHPLARLVVVADTFCYFAVKGSQAEPLPPGEAIRRMISLHAKELDTVFLHALMRVFNVEHSTDLKRAS